MSNQRTGIGLNDREARVLAQRIVARHIDNSDMWLEWEDYPYLNEDAFILLDEQVREIAKTLWKWSTNFDLGWELDSAYLEEQATE